MPDGPIGSFPLATPYSFHHDSGRAAFGCSVTQYSIELHGPGGLTCEAYSLPATASRPRLRQSEAPTSGMTGQPSLPNSAADAIAVLVFFCLAHREIRGRLGRWRRADGRLVRSAGRVVWKEAVA